MTTTTEPAAREDEIAERFARDTQHHKLTVLHDQNLYRHLWCVAPQTTEFWYELITWPGGLAIHGDYGTAFTFSRQPDMFQLFRRDTINPHYWAQKVESGRDAVREYSTAVWAQTVRELFVSAVRHDDAPRGLGLAVRELLNEEPATETAASVLLERFEYEGWDFGDTWDLDFRDYAPDFLWACHAIVAGVRQYDAAKAPGADRA